MRGRCRPGHTDAGIRSGALWRVGRSGCCRGGAVLPVDGRFCRGLITGPDLTTTSPERSRVVAAESCKNLPSAAPLGCYPVVLGLDPRDSFSGLSARSHFCFRNGNDLRGRRPGFAARGIRPYALGHHAPETCVHLTTQPIRGRLRDAVCARDSQASLMRERGAECRKRILGFSRWSQHPADRGTS